MYKLMHINVKLYGHERQQAQELEKAHEQCNYLGAVHYYIYSHYDTITAEHTLHTRTGDHAMPIMIGV
jgi:hypothetical protein